MRHGARVANTLNISFCFDAHFTFAPFLCLRTFAPPILFSTILTILNSLFSETTKTHHHHHNIINSLTTPEFTISILRFCETLEFLKFAGCIASLYTLIYLFQKNIYCTNRKTNISYVKIIDFFWRSANGMRAWGVYIIAFILMLTFAFHKWKNANVSGMVLKICWVCRTSFADGPYLGTIRKTSSAKVRVEEGVPIRCELNADGRVRVRWRG
jgi:hypothetical protein